MEIKAEGLQIGYGDSLVVDDMDIHLKKGGDYNNYRAEWFWKIDST